MSELRDDETSPQPLPRPDIDPLSEYDPHKLSHLEPSLYEKTNSYQVNLSTVYENDNKMDNYNMDVPDPEEKVHLGEKYLFPYTGIDNLFVINDEHESKTLKVN